MEKFINVCTEYRYVTDIRVNAEKGDMVKKCLKRTKLSEDMRLEFEGVRNNKEICYTKINNKLYRTLNEVEYKILICGVDSKLYGMIE